MYDMEQGLYSTDDRSHNVFLGMKIHILPSGIGLKRLSLFENLVKSNGGLITSKTTDDSVTHIVIEEKLFSDPNTCWKILEKASYVAGSDVKIVSTAYLSECLKKKETVSTAGFELIGGDPTKKELFDKRLCEEEQTQNTGSNPVCVTECVSSPSLVLEYHSPPKKLKHDVEKFACSQPSIQSRHGVLCNMQITTELQKLADAFRNRGDQWRTHGYEKAISAIKAHNKPITSLEEAKALPGVGAKMAAKVMEILECGNLRKVKAICEDEKTKVLDLFTKVWGVGPTTADGWYQQGFRSLDDLQTKANLTKQQKIGLKHFEDLQDRIPREEVEQIGSIVRDAVISLDSQLQVVLCGSYRRGKVTCGDVDILIAKPNDCPRDILSQLLEDLKRTGFITDDLVSVEVKGNQKKYLGVCHLPGVGQKHRRLDIFVVPKTELAPALMHYTGSALFNRSIRLLAIKKGMSLSEHSLQAGVVRKGKDMLNGGYSLPTPTEESIFEHLELEYRTPEERDH